MAEARDGPTLRLTMEKGPLEGQIRDFIPRSRSEIKIGRVVRGNTLAIKDDGISSKHALIRFDSHPGRVGFWTVSDLGSSNGTVLNGRALEPYTPATLSDGDVIKIGELTSIIVKLEDVRVDVEEESKARRKPPLRGRNVAVVDLKKETPLGGDDENKRNVRGRSRRGKAALENSEVAVVDLTKETPLGADDENKRNVRGRSRRGKAALENSEVAELKGLNEVEMASSKRVTRSASRTGNGVETDFVELDNLERRDCLRRKGRRKKEEENLDENGVRDVEDVVDFREDVVLEERCRKGIQEESLKSEKENDSEILDGNEIQDSEEVKMFVPIEAKGGENLSLRRTTRNLRKGGNIKSSGEKVVENTRRGRGRRGKKNFQMETLMENDEAAEIGKEEEVVGKINSERLVLEELKQGLQEEGEGFHGLTEEGVQLAEAGCEALASTSGIKNDSIELDLEKINLEKWFEFLDVDLPKQIIDATEDMILGMTQKAKKFHDFMLQQKNSKSKVELQ